MYKFGLKKERRTPAGPAAASLLLGFPSRFLSFAPGRLQVTGRLSGFILHPTSKRRFNYDQN